MLTKKTTDVFICYRRLKDFGTTEKIYNALKKPLGKKYVFMDTEGIQPGTQWSERIDEALTSARLVLAIIGPTWLDDLAGKKCPKDPKPEEGKPEEAQDWVIWELDKALKCKKKVLPVRIDGAPSLHEGALPDCITSLATLQYFKVRKKTQEKDIEQLVEKVRRELRPNDEEVQELVGEQKTVVERYEIEGRLGHREASSVWKAFDNQLKRHVAIKVLHESRLAQEFDRRIKKVTPISDGPNFITIYDFNCQKRLHYFVMQFIESQTLREKLDQYRRLPQKKDFPLQTAINILRNLGKALVRSHNLNIVHGKIKPSEILLTKDDEPYISFVHKVYQADEEWRQLQKAHGASSKHERSEALVYLIPENYETGVGKATVPELADQYLLGRVAYEMLTGTFPPTPRRYKDVENEKTKAFKPLPSIRKKRPDCPEGLDRMIQRMAHPDPEQRFEKLEDALEIIPANEPYALVVARASYKRCLQQDATLFFKTFYDRFKGSSERVNDIFIKAGFTDSEKKGLNKWPRQYKKLGHALEVLFLYCEQTHRYEHYDEDPLLKSDYHPLRPYVDVHKKYGVDEDLYQLFVDALIETVCHGKNPLDNECKDNDHQKELIERSWRKVLERGVKYMYMSSK